jgi:hypothetical protein
VIWVVVEFIYISSAEVADFVWSNGIFRSSCKVLLETYHGAFVIFLSNLDWKRCRMPMLDLLAVPQIRIPYVHIGFNMTLYKRILLLRDDFDLGLRSQDILLNLEFSWSHFIQMWFRQFGLLSRWTPRYFTELQSSY